MTTKTQRTLQIDLYSDIACPWCFIGIKRLDKALADLDPSVDVTVRHHTYLLTPDLGPEGADMVERLRAKYGVDPRQMFARVEEAAHETGIPMDFSKLERTYPTVAAHTLVRHAHAKGTQRALTEDLFRAYFLDARNVSDTDVLIELGIRHGFDADEVSSLVHDASELELTRREAQQTTALGITGVPLFVFQRKLAVSGAQSPETFRQAIAKAMELSVDEPET